jgi:hypothetical protein
MAEIECDEIGSIIITLALITHGSTIETGLSPEKQQIFENVRIFSLAGTFQESFHSRDERNLFLKDLNESFQKDLTEPTSNIIDHYAAKMRPIYQQEMSTKSSTVLSEKVCRIFNKITIDKLLSEIPPATFFESTMECIMPPNLGIFVISIHQKREPNDFKLLYPPLLSSLSSLSHSNSHTNLNLLNIADFISFAAIFGKSLPEKLFTLSLKKPSKNVDPEIIKLITENSNLSNNEKEFLLQQQIEEIAKLTQLWNVTISEDHTHVEAIRMSTLVQIIKDIVEHPNTKINLLDYSCTSTTPRTSRSSSPVDFTPFHPLPIISKTWGGRRNGRRGRKKSKRRKNYTHNKSRKK